jgi:hypothetical protein
MHPLKEYVNLRLSVEIKIIRDLLEAHSISLFTIDLTLQSLIVIVCTNYLNNVWRCISGLSKLRPANVINERYRCCFGFWHRVINECFKNQIKKCYVPFCVSVYILKIVQLLHRAKRIHLQLQHSVRKSWEFTIIFKVNSSYLLYILTHVW